jgi:hypothetical protein
VKSTRARRFHAKAAPEPSLVQGARASSLVTILDGATEIGSYRRNYPAFAEETFEPFELGGTWYALYSRDYTSTRVMKLPECKDVGGEEPNPLGFCPVEFFVPRYRKVVMTQSAAGRVTEYLSFESKGEERPDQPTLDGHEFAYGPWLSLDTAFVAGCLWGDDSTWKLEVIDLSRAAEGIIPRSARFGHVQLGKMPLAEAVLLDSNLPHWELRASIIRRERRDIRSGALIDPYDE